MIPVSLWFTFFFFFLCLHRCRSRTKKTSKSPLLSSCIYTKSHLCQNRAADCAVWPSQGQPHVVHKPLCLAVRLSKAAPRTPPGWATCRAQTESHRPITTPSMHVHVHCCSPEVGHVPQSQAADHGVWILAVFPQGVDDQQGKLRV